MTSSFTDWPKLTAVLMQKRNKNDIERRMTENIFKLGSIIFGNQCFREHNGQMTYLIYEKL